MGSPVTISWDHLRKIFDGCQQMAKVPNAVEILPKISTAWVGHMSATDDRQTTDGRAIAYSERNVNKGFSSLVTFYDFNALFAFERFYVSFYMLQNAPQSFKTR